MIRKLPMGGFSPWKALSFILLFSFIAGCVQESTDEGLIVSDNGNVPGVFAPDAGPSWNPPEALDTSPGDDPAEVPGEEVNPEESPPEKEETNTCPGGFLCPCEDNGDCLEGYCVPSPQGLVCTESCLDECPDGWACEALLGEGPDIVFFCMPSFPQLCQPCASSGECQAAGNEDALCVVYGENEGQFCGSGCLSDSQCPDGYICDEVITAEGASSQQCRLNGAEECPCEPAWEGLTTPCAASNEVGICSGSRACIDGFLTECNAADAAEEICDGADNDCDGLIDEDLCDDGIGCTVDKCIPETGCVNEAFDSFCPEGTACKDALCDPLEGCALVPLTGKPCDDDSVCTLEDACSEGACTGAPLDCDDGNVCTIDSCSAIQGCISVANTANCDDGNACTLDDACSDGGCIASGSLSCQDGNGCTEDLCDAIAGCVFPPNTADCNDGNACTVNDACGGGSCNGGAAKTCDDGNSCTNDSCNPNSGCVFNNNSVGCNDGNKCTTDDHCSGGGCVGGGSKSCNDGNQCTNDSCSPNSGCVFTNNSKSCNDGNQCTTDDHCSGGGCVGGGTKTCNDGKKCTNDSCSPNSGCVFTNNSKSCNDGNQCTINDHCGGGSCKGGGTKNCDDGDTCTADSCSPSFGCQHTLIPGCGYGGGCE